jgi:hypothetical protein
MNVDAPLRRPMIARPAALLVMVDRVRTRRREALLNEALEQSFSASDPVSSLRFD